MYILWKSLMCVFRLSNEFYLWFYATIITPPHFQRSILIETLNKVKYK